MTALSLNLYDFLARQYDPATGRFTSVDPKADVMPYMSTYAGMMNNPMYYTDADGECPICIIFIGGFINLISKMAQGDINSMGDFFGSFAVGGLSGLAGAGMGGLIADAVGGTVGFGAGALVGAGGGAAGGFVAGAGNAWLGGASFSDGLRAGASGAFAGAVGGAVFGGIGGALEKGSLMRNARSQLYASSTGNEYAFNKTSGEFKYLGTHDSGDIHFVRTSEAGANNATDWVATTAKTYFIEGHGIAAFRFMQTSTSTISGFIVASTGVTGYGLEPRGASTSAEGRNRRIPVGNYNLDCRI